MKEKLSIKKYLNRKNVCIGLMVGLIIVFIIPYMGVIYYTMPRNDEFAAAFGIVTRGGYSLRGLCKCVAEDYMNWEGNYSGIFIYTMLNPLVIGDIDITVRLMNVLCFAGFVAGWIYIIYRCLSWFNIEKWDKYLMSVVTLVMLMNCRFLRETLGWYTGFMYYTIQLLLGTVGMFLVWNLIDKKPDKKWKSISVMIVACLFEVIGAGGTLHVSAILCFIILVFLIWIIYSKKEWIKAAILFGAIFISTLINALAPGHRVRKGDYESISLVKGVIYTLVCVYNEIRRICSETYIPYILVIVFIALFFMIKGTKKCVALNPVIVAVAGLCCIVGSSFPVCYGYARASMASRGYEMMDLMIIMWSILLLCSIVNALKGIDFKLNSNSIFILAVIGVFYFTSYTIANVEVSDIPSVQCIAGLANGSIKDYSAYWFDVLHQVEDAEGGDVVIKVKGEYMDRECMIDRCLFTEEPTDWVNNAAAVYYGYDTIRLERID